MSYFSFTDWGKQIDEKERQNREFVQRHNLEVKAAKIQREEDFIRKFGNYWYTSYADVWVKVGKYGLPSLDKVNSAGIFELNLDNNDHSVFTTLLAMNPMPEPYTIEEYHNKFCTFNEEENRWYLN